MNLIESFSTAARLHCNAPDAVMFDELSKVVEQFNTSHSMKLNITNEVNDYLVLRAKFRRVAA